jgi:uncharacterized protein YbjT (DUF2867 family)
MDVILFGATGMIGQGVLRECLLDPRVGRVLSIGRSSTGHEHPKLRELVLPDLLDYSLVKSEVKSELAGFDACFFCLGVSSAGMSESDYRRVTFDITLAAARTLADLNPRMRFLFISGAGTDSTEHGRTMWARVKGETENALSRLPFRGAFMFRPAFIQPMHGARSRTRSYRLFYAVTRPLMPLLRWILPGYVTTTDQLARAMIRVAADGAPERILHTSDINRVSVA